MPQQTSRRKFMQTTAATVGAGFWVTSSLQAQESKSPNEKIQFACIGIGGKGSSDSADAKRHGEVVAICDVDEKRLSNAKMSKFKEAETFFDYREMYDKLGDKIDAVTVSTPDHSHAPASVMGMKLGKHCFCQKPMTHSIYEARFMGDLAKQKGIATQMGNQGTADARLREAAAILQSGGLGKVSEVHVWTNRPVWPQGGPRPKEEPVPPHLKWDLFLGPAPERPYGKGYAPFAWRGWWDFGTGALGDMACHTMNMPFMGLDLRNPTSVQAKTSGHNKDSFPKWSRITYEFPATDSRPALKMIWYDGGEKPDIALFDGLPKGKSPNRSGALIIGEKGKLYSPSDYGGSFELWGLERPKVEFERSPGHFTEFANAIKGGPAARSNFPEYASPLTETVLLGNLAVWVDGEKVEWDAKNLKVKNISGLEKMIKHDYREGYTL